MQIMPIAMRWSLAMPFAATATRNLRRLLSSASIAYSAMKLSSRMAMPAKCCAQPRLRQAGGLHASSEAVAAASWHFRRQQLMPVCREAPAPAAGLFCCQAALV